MTYKCIKKTCQYEPQSFFVSERYGIVVPEKLHGLKICMRELQCACEPKVLPKETERTRILGWSWASPSSSILERATTAPEACTASVFALIRKDRGDLRACSSQAELDQGLATRSVWRSTWSASAVKVRRHPELA